MDRDTNLLPKESDEPTAAEGTESAPMTRDGTRTDADVDGAARQGPVHVWLVRHGQRADESAEKKLFYAQTPRERWFDPPLTERGGFQAAAAAERVSRF